MSEDDSENRIHDIKIEQPEFPLTVSEQLLTVPSDFVQIAFDHETQLCTFNFFQKHPMPKQTERGIQYTGMHDELFLQVKVPMNSAFALGEYMHGILQRIRTNGPMRGFSFGPTSIEEKKP